jgi:hypothetical protein
MMEGVNSTKIYCKNFCKCHNTPPVHNNNDKNGMERILAKSNVDRYKWSENSEKSLYKEKDHFLIFKILSRDLLKSVKQSGRDESMWVAIHMCKEATLGISLYSYPCLKLEKTLCLSNYCLCLLFNKIGEEGRTGSTWKQGGGGNKRGGREEGRNGPSNVCTYK